MASKPTKPSLPLRPKSDEAAEAHYELGMHHYREKDYKAAQTQFDAIVNNFPQLELSQTPT